jgi:hypothetical protein
MQKQLSDLWESAGLVMVGILLLVVIFAVPDIGYAEHKSIFGVAAQSAWGHFFDWPSAWCSAKIILLGVAALAFVNAVLGLLLDTDFEGANTVVVISAILPMLVGIFGLYELVKAIL